MLMDPTLYKRDETPKSFFNPLSFPVNVEYRDEKNNVLIIAIPPLKISEFPTYKADILIKHLVDAIINDRELGIVTPEDRKEIEKEVFI